MGATTRSSASSTSPVLVALAEASARGVPLGPFRERRITHHAGRRATSTTLLHLDTACAYDQSTVTVMPTTDAWAVLCPSCHGVTATGDIWLEALQVLADAVAAARELDRLEASALGAHATGLAGDPEDDPDDDLISSAARRLLNAAQLLGSEHFAAYNRPGLSHAHATVVDQLLSLDSIGVDRQDHGDLVEFLRYAKARMLELETRFTRVATSRHVESLLLAELDRKQWMVAPRWLIRTAYPPFPQYASDAQRLYCALVIELEPIASTGELALALTGTHLPDRGDDLLVPPVPDATEADLQTALALFADMAEQERTAEMFTSLLTATMHARAPLTGRS